MTNICGTSLQSYLIRRNCLILKGVIDNFAREELFLGFDCVDLNKVPVESSY